MPVSRKLRKSSDYGNVFDVSKRTWTQCFKALADADFGVDRP